MTGPVLRHLPFDHALPRTNTSRYPVKERCLERSPGRRADHGGPASLRASRPGLRSPLARAAGGDPCAQPSKKETSP